MISLFLSIPLALISTVGLILNGYIFIVILITKQVSTANNILLLHLGSVNILLGILFLIFCIPGIKETEWSIAGAPCVFHGFLFTLFHPLALWTICGLNCDRFYVIAAPLHYTHIVSAKKVFAGLGAGWLIALTLCIPPLFTIAPYSYIPGLGACAPDFGAGDGTLWYATVFTAFTLLLPATVIICCNLKILMIARYHRHRIASAIYEVTLSAQVTITHQRNPFFVPTVTAPSSGGPKFRGRSAIYSVFQLVGSFLVLYVPYYVIILWEATTKSFIDKSHGVPNPELIEKPPTYFYTLASTLLISTLPINGFLYGLKNKTLRKTFQNYWRKKQTKSEVNQEIQARTPSTCGSRRPSLTPALGFLAKPSLQRRLSETLLDVNKAIRSPQRNKIKRIASELTWRPASANSLNLSPNDETAPKHQIKQTTSCNTLQVPNDDVSTITEDEIYLRLQKHKEEQPDTPSKPNSANLFLQRLFKFEQEKLSKKTASAVQNVLDGSPRRSPRILITRAFSEESDKTSQTSSPTRELSKKHSSSATILLERKWRNMRFKDDQDSDTECHRATMKPLLDSSSLSNRSSESSENSDAGRIFMSIDQKGASMDQSENESNEDQLLLSWNVHKKYGKEENLRKSNKSLVKQTMSSLQTQEMVL